MEEREEVKFVSDIFISACDGVAPVEPEFFIGKARRYVKNVIKYHSSAAFTGRREPMGFLEDHGVVYKLARNISSASLEDSFWKTGFDGFGSKSETVVDVRDIAKKELNLIIHGQAGSGKTAILQRIMLLSLRGSRIPVLIDLKEKGENKTSIADFIIGFILDEFDIGKFPKAALLVSKMLSNGKFLILCDGLESLTPELSAEFAEFSGEYSNLRFIAACRTAYRQVLTGFTNLEVTGFREEQVKYFVNAWFKDSPDRAEGFLKKMSSACYESQKLLPFPLFLGMLCFVFDENMDFPSSRAELCEAVIVLLLRTWHGYEKGSVLYRNMPVKRKLDMLAKIAHRAFSSGRRTLHKDEFEADVLGFIKELPKRNDLEPDLYEFIRTIESEHGLVTKQWNSYSFPTPFLQEYLAAKHIINSGAFDSARFAEPAWREVVLLVVFMMPSGDEFLKNMQKYTRSLFVGEKKILKWAEEKSNQAKAPYPSVSVRAFYVSINSYFLFPELYDCGCEMAELLGLSRCINADLTKEFNISRTGKFLIILNLDRELVSMVNELSASGVNYVAFTALHGKDYAEYIDERLGICVNIALRLNEFEFIGELYALKKRIPTEQSLPEEWESFRSDLRDAAFECRDVCIEFEPHLENIKSYLYANKVLAECMNLECCISPETRKQLVMSSMAS